MVYSKEKNMEEILIASCGMNCALCSNYMAMKFNLKEAGIQKTYCAGCRPRGKNCAFMKKHCVLLGEGRVKYCLECEQYPCKHLKQLDERYRKQYHMSMIENLDDIKDYGIKKFLEQQEKKWKCPECGGVICCHNGICYSCGLEKLKNKRKKYQWTDD
jgi:hypothetical protein